MYLSILYLRLPQNFGIILRWKVVEHHSIAHDLKFPELIVHRPHTGEVKDVSSFCFSFHLVLVLACVANGSNFLLITFLKLPFGHFGFLFFLHLTSCVDK